MDQATIYYVNVEKINGASGLVLHRKSNPELSDELKKLVKERYRCEATLQLLAPTARSLKFEELKQLQDAGLKLIDINDQIIKYYEKKEE